MPSPPLSSRERLFRRARRAFGAASALATAFVIGWRYGVGLSPIYPLLAVSLVAAAVLFLRGGTASQLLARAGLFASLLDGLYGQLQNGPALWPIAAGLGLLVSADVGLGEREGDAFKPAAHRGLIALTVVVALGAAQHLALYGWVYRQWDGSIGPNRHVAGSIMIGCAAWLSAASFGLYRLRVWGLLAAASGGALLAWLMLGNVLRLMPLSWPLAYELGLLGLTLVALSVPVFGAIAGRPPRPLAAWFGRRLPAVAAAAMVAWAVAFALGPGTAGRVLRALHPSNVVDLAGG